VAALKASIQPMKYAAIYMANSALFCSRSYRKINYQKSCGILREYPTIY
jgi:hypothetical protein